MLDLDSPCSITSSLNSIKKTRKQRYQKVNEDLIRHSPIQQMTVPKNSIYRSTFQRFLQGTITENEFVKCKNFPQSQSIHNVKYDFVPTLNQLKSFKDLSHDDLMKQSMRKIKNPTKRNRFFDLTLQVKRDNQNTVSTQEQALHRWKLLQKIVQNNIQLRRQILEERKKQMKLLGSIENEIHKQSDFSGQILKSHQLRTMTVLKEQRINQNIQQRNSPRHFHYLLALQFKDNSDDFIFLHSQILGSSINHISDSPYLYDKKLRVYLNKKELFEKWMEEQKQRKVIKWKQKNNISIHSTTHSIGLNKSHPMQRVQNPLSLTQKASDLKSKLINEVNDIEMIEKDSSSQLRQLLNISTKGQKKKNQNGVIKHNRILSQQIALSGETMEDDQDNLSNASITEALLVQLYQGSYTLQHKLQNNKNQTVQRKIRDFLKLQELKLQTIQANRQKLLPKKQQNQ